MLQQHERDKIGRELSRVLYWSFPLQQCLLIYLIVFTVAPEKAAQTVVANEKNLIVVCSLSHMRGRGRRIALKSGLFLSYSEAGGKSGF